MHEDVWGVGNFSYEDVLACPSLALGDTPNAKVNDWTFNSPEYHIARIAWLGTHGWETGGEYAMELILEDGGLYLFDGNHRYCAALVFHKEVTFYFYGDNEEFQKMLDKA